MAWTVLSYQGDQAGVYGVSAANTKRANTSLTSVGSEADSRSHGYCPAIDTCTRSRYLARSLPYGGEVCNENALEVYRLRGERLE